ncbi:MAG TPA: PKD domain-containing protein, partial [Pirellulaceae bacterium]|nr:PKD domain-containing protein [Pirellulaceae bacterium]
TIHAGTGNDTIDGGDGDDSIIGGNGNGNGFIFGGFGNDTIQSGTGNETIDGGAGDDSLMGGDGNGFIFGGFGNDTIHSGTGDETLDGGDGDDSLTGGDGNGNGFFFGGFGNDTIQSGTGNDTIYGGDGNDSITGGDGNGFIFGGFGNDTIQSGTGNETIDGGDGDDSLAGGDGNGFIFGGFGNDTIQSGTGNDTLDGGDGDDSLTGGNGNGNGFIFGGFGNDTIQSGTGNDTIYGGDGNDSLTGGSGNGFIFGGFGNDTIYSGSGDETIYGGEGNGLIFGDDWVVEQADADITLTDNLLTGNGTTTLFEINHAVLIGGAGDNELDARGFSGNVYLIGAAGNDTLRGGTGDDTLEGGVGDDLLEGGLGGDTYRFAGGNLGTDTINEPPNDSGDTLDFFDFAAPVNLNMSSLDLQTIASGHLTLLLQTPEHIDNAVGSSFSDVIVGNELANKLQGAGGADRLEGMGGDDILEGGLRRFVFLDFNSATETDAGEHDYSADERDAIAARIEKDFAPFDIKVVQTVPTGVSFITILFNETPIIGGVPQPGGESQRVGWRGLERDGRVIVDVNGFFGSARNQLKPTAENYIALSSTIASHELAHMYGLRHHDAFGEPGTGIFAGLDPRRFLPFFPGPRTAVDSAKHLLASPASIGTRLIDALGDPEFGPRELLKLAYLDQGVVEFELESLKQTRIVQEAGVAMSVPVQSLNPDVDGAPGPLPSLAAPGVIAASINIVGSIELDSTGRSESDYYAFVGNAGDVLTIEVLSHILKQRIANPIDSIIRVYDAAGRKIGYHADNDPEDPKFLGAFNDDGFEPTDSILIDLLLPADGIYIVEVGTFSADLAEVPLYLPGVDAFCRDNPDREVCSDVDTGDYELLLYRFGNNLEGDDLLEGGLGGDTLAGGDGADTLVGSSGPDTFLVDQYDVVEDASGTSLINYAPTFDPSDPFTTPLSGIEGQKLQGNANAIDPEDAAIVYSLEAISGELFPTGATIDRESGAFDWTPVEDGVYKVRVRVSDPLGLSDSQEFAFTISNAAPIFVPGGDDILPELKEGDSFSRRIFFTDTGALDTHSATVNYGDGLGSQLLLIHAGNTIDLNHQYKRNGEFTATVTVRDDDGGIASKSFVVTVSNIDPVVTPAASQSASEGVAAVFELGSFADPGADAPWQVTVDWGDDSADNVFTVMSASGLGNLAHTYADNGVYTVTVTVAEQDGFGVATFAVTVSNVAPLIALDGAASVVEGFEYTLTLGAVTDPGDDTVKQFIVDWGDGRSETFWTAGPKTHVYADDESDLIYADDESDLIPNGTRNIRVDLVDEDGTFVGAGTKSLIVENANPVLTTANLVTRSFEPLSLSVTYTDSGFDDPTGTPPTTEYLIAATIDWGDGTIEPATISKVAASIPTTGQITAKHMYTSTGLFTATVTVEDDDGGVASSAFQVDVRLGHSIFVLNAGDPGALSLTGDAAINVEGRVVVNSGSSSAIRATGNARITASSVEVVGGVDLTGEATVSPAPTRLPWPVADPLGAMPAPYISGPHQGAITCNDGVQKLAPGVYEKILATGNCQLVLQSGIYVIAGGGLRVTGSAGVTGNEVLIYNTSNAAGQFGSIFLSGSGVINLSPLPSGDQAGVVIFQDRDNYSLISLSGNVAASGLAGTLYAPAAMLTISGPGQTDATLIVDRISLSGSVVSNLVVTDDLSGGINELIISGQLLRGDILVNFAGNPTVEQRDRLLDALESLNMSFAAFGVTLVEAEVDEAEYANVSLIVAADSPCGNASDGVLGCADVTGVITLLDGWNWFTGSDASLIGADQYDFQTIVTHELSHALGLGHSEDAQSVMYDVLTASQIRRELTVADMTLIHEHEAGAEALFAEGFVKRAGDGSHHKQANDVDDDGQHGCCLCAVCSTTRQTSLFPGLREVAERGDSRGADGVIGSIKLRVDSVGVPPGRGGLGEWFFDATRLRHDHSLVVLGPGLVRQPSSYRDSLDTLLGKWTNDGVFAIQTTTPGADLPIRRVREAVKLDALDVDALLAHNQGDSDFDGPKSMDLLLGAGAHLRADASTGMVIGEIG